MEKKELIFDKISKINIYKLLHIRGMKRLVIVRPKIPDDAYTVFGSYEWAGLVKQKALDLGWQVTDLAINDATRENVEDKINNIHPTLVMHYDHGSTFTLWGQENNSLEAAIDSANVGIIAHRITSTVSCLSAGGLGPLAITNGAISYLGYDDLHVFVMGHQDQFGEAANAANYALLECKSVEEAYQIGIDAYNALYNDLIATGDAFAASWVLHDRDCFVFLGRACADACPRICCRIGLPDRRLEPLCRIGLPDRRLEPLCRIGLPDRRLEPLCRIGLPDSYLIEKCAAGPMIELDIERVPDKFKKSLTQLLEQIKMEK